MDNKLVKLYGLKHSGSHYLDWLLKHNTEEVVVLHNQTGWNHGEIQTKFNWNVETWNTDPIFRMDSSYDAHIKNSVLLTRDLPVSEYKKEIQTLYQYNTLPLIILMRSPYSWIYSNSVKHAKASNNATFEDSAIMWNRMNRNYIEETTFPKLFIKFENLQQNPEEELKRVAEFLDVELTTPFINSDRDMIQKEHGVDVPFINDANVSLKGEVDKWLAPDILNFYNSL